MFPIKHEAPIMKVFRKTVGFIAVFEQSSICKVWFVELLSNQSGSIANKGTSKFLYVTSQTVADTFETL